MLKLEIKLRRLAMNANSNHTNVESLSYKGLLYERYPSQKRYTWDEAVEYANQLKKKSMKNWRLATVEELQKLYAKANKKVFEEIAMSWSQDDENPHTAWVMDFESNLYYLRNKNFKFRVICVQDTVLKRSINFF